MTEQTAMILCLVSGERIVGMTKDNGMFWEVEDPFTLQENFIDDEDSNKILSQLALISFTAYSVTTTVSIPKQHVICVMAPSNHLIDIYREESKSVKEQKEEQHAKDSAKKEKTSGSVTPFKKRH
jgi:hypothetical protein